jgi:hypothetical protein
MKWSFAIGLAFVLVATPRVRGEENLETLKKQWIATASDIVDTLKKITDETSANKSRPQLKKLKTKLDDIKARQAKLVLGDFAQYGDLEKKYAKEVQAINDGWAKETTRVQKVKGGPEALKELQ